MNEAASIFLDKRGGTHMKCRVKMTMALLCLLLIAGGPYGPLPFDGALGADSATAAPGDTQDSASTDTGTDDTPSAQDIADFASQYDKDGDGEVDDPEESSEPADEPAEEAEADQQDFQDDTNDDEQDDEEFDEDYDGQENLVERDDTGDAANTREDIDGDASPDLRISGFDRYPVDKRLRRLGEFSSLTPLIEREEQLLFEY